MTIKQQALSPMRKSESTRGINTERERENNKTTTTTNTSSFFNFPPMPVFKVVKKQHVTWCYVKSGLYGGWYRSVTFLPQHTELWPLLCRAQHCPGVTECWDFHVWSPPCTAEKEWAKLCLCCGGWSFLSSSLVESNTQKVQKNAIY